MVSGKLKFIALIVLFLANNFAVMHQALGNLLPKLGAKTIPLLEANLNYWQSQQPVEAA